MSKEKAYFSASEINKFTYCNYSWYYERKKYVVKYTKNNNNSITQKNFKRGIKFHENYYMRNKKLELIKRTVILLFITILFFYFLIEVLQWI